MLRNYLLIVYRNLWHNKVYALINIVGLAIGLTAALFIFQYVQFERSYDSFHENADNIYRFTMQINRPDASEPTQHFAASDFAPIIKNECPEIVECARLFKNWTDNFIISYDPADGTPSLDFSERKVYYVDAAFMKMFSFPMLLGDPATLQEPNTVLLSEDLARKFFGADWPTDDIIGKTLTVNGERTFMVQGVFENVPENSHIKFEALLSLTTLASELHYDTEILVDFPIYLQVDPQTDIRALETKLRNIHDQHYANLFKLSIDSIVVGLQPVKAAHLYSFGFKREHEVRGNASTVQFLLVAGVIILILAWINYVNLSTARAVKRAKEVGIRKVVGAGRPQLIGQFLLEAFLINIFSLVIALTLYQLCYPLFTHLVQKEIPVNSLLETPQLLIGVVVVLIAGTLLSGGYSAFVLSSFRAVSMMKGKFHTSTRGILLRKSLIVFQFAISVGLIIGTFSVYQQLVFMKNYDMGYDQSQKLIVRAPQITTYSYVGHYESFKNSVEQLSEIKQVTASSLSPGDPGGRGDYFVVNVKEPETSHLISLNMVDYDYLEIYDIEPIYGRGFSRDFPADNNAVVITEELALQLGFDPVETAVQEKIMVNAPGFTDKELSVIGVVRNINLRSLQLESTGVVFLLQTDTVQKSPGALQPNYYTVDLEGVSHLPENLAEIEVLYRSLFPGNPFQYFFLDEYFNAQYQGEEQFGKVFTAASSLAIFIACLGLFGLSAFMVRQRTQEIGIRKVLGAPVRNILLLLSRDYIRLIAIAGLIALPIAYFSLQQWLGSYMVRIQLSWWLFFIPILLVVIIALATVSLQTIIAALANPAKSLKYE